MTDRTDLPELLTKDQVAVSLGVSVRTVERLIKDRILPAVYPSKRAVRITADALQAHITSTTSEAVK